MVILVLWLFFIIHSLNTVQQWSPSPCNYSSYDNALRPPLWVFRGQFDRNTACVSNWWECTVLENKIFGKEIARVVGHKGLYSKTMHLTRYPSP